MTPEDFVRAVKLQASDAAVRITHSNLRQPAGRTPKEDKLRLSRWFMNLAEADQEAVSQVIRETADSAVFGFLAILDGVRVVEKTKEKGEFELYFVKGGEKTLLNPHPGEDLHDIYKWLTQEG